MASNSRRLPGIFSVFCLCLLVTLSVSTATVDVRAASHETAIETYELKLILSTTTYQNVNQTLSSARYGPEPIIGAIAEGLDVERSQIQYEIEQHNTGTEYDRGWVFNNETYIVSLKIENFSPGENSHVSLQEIDGSKLIYEDRLLSGQTTIGKTLAKSRSPVYFPIKARTTVRMPYDVVDSNANEVAGPSASWIREIGNDELVLRAESIIPIPPVARFTIEHEGENPVVGKEIRFDASGSTDDQEVTTYNWHFGDGKRATGSTVHHRYEEPGNYMITLVVTDGDDLDDKAARTLSVEKGTFPWLWVLIGLLSVGLVGGVYLWSDSRRESVDPPIEVSELVIVRAVEEEEFTDVEVRNDGGELWTTPSNAEIEDANGNRHALPRISIEPGHRETIRFNARDEEAFTSRQGDRAILHTNDGERLIRWVDTGLSE